MSNSGQSPGSSARETANETWRISEVMHETGLSKELIHHYLRQGLVPRSDSRARYTRQQVRLLRQIRILREDHNLPLEIIRRIFTIFDFVPERIEPLVLSESLCRRVTRLADGDLTSQVTYDEAELARAAEVSSERLAEYSRAGIITPLDGNGGPRFSAYDAHVVALCECGVEIGIPFESFRTVASHIRLAFELEHAEFFTVQPEALDAGRVFASLFLRGELVGNFVVNMLGALMEQQLRKGLGQPSPQRLTLGEIVYQPSAVFVRRHGLDERLDRARKRCAMASDPALWLEAARLLLHAGRYTEAVFFLEQSHKRWPESKAVRTAYGRALVLAGDAERGAEHLAGVANRDDDPLAAIYVALAQFERAQAADQPEALVHAGVGIVHQVEHALARAAQAAPASRIEAHIIGGWLLSAMPQLLGCYDRGRQLLAQVVRELEQHPELLATDLPGLRDRYRINAAFLLFHCLARDESSNGPAVAAQPTAPATSSAEAEPTLDELRTIVCSLDPASSFAHSVFLEGRDRSSHRGDEP